MSYQISSCIEDKKYRYSLEVTTDVENINKMIIFQINPSKGNSIISDPTIGKVSYWAEENKFKYITFLNLFALVSTTPDELIGKAYDEIVGEMNNKVILSSINQDSTIILAWGGIATEIEHHYRRRVFELMSLLDNFKLFRVGKLSYNKYPRHGRAWNLGNRELVDFNWKEIGF